MGAVQAATPGGGERFTIMLGAATSLAALEQWFASAFPGDRAIYASGFTCPSEHESVKRAREWAEAGRAHLTQDRDPADARRWLYYITKGSEAARGLVSVVAEIKAKPDLSREQMRFLMRRLRKIARDGEPCPSYAAMAKDLCLRPDNRGRQRARYLLNRLEREKRIAITPGDAVTPLVVTILAPGMARGKSTKGGT